MQTVSYISQCTYREAECCNAFRKAYQAKDIRRGATSARRSTIPDLAENKTQRNKIYTNERQTGEQDRVAVVQPWHSFAPTPPFELRPLLILRDLRAYSTHNAMHSFSLRYDSLFRASSGLRPLRSSPLCRSKSQLGSTEAKRDKNSHPLPCNGDKLVPLLFSLSRLPRGWD